MVINQISDCSGLFVLRINTTLQPIKWMLVTHITTAGYLMARDLLIID